MLALVNSEPICSPCGASCRCPRLPGRNDANGGHLLRCYARPRNATHPLGLFCWALESTSNPIIALIRGPRPMRPTARQHKTAGSPWASVNPSPTAIPANALAPPDGPFEADRSAWKQKDLVARFATPTRTSLAGVSPGNSGPDAS